MSLKSVLGVLLLLPTLGKAFAADIPSSLIQLGAGPFYSKYAFVVDKKARMLSVWSRENGQVQKIAEFASDMGKNSGDKVSRGDAKTPEGIYFLQTQLEGRKQIPFELYGLRAFTTDYPNVFDRRAGKTGSGIWLHAIPDTETLERGSKGCVVVRNSSILELSKFVSLGRTPLLIEDEVKMVPDTSLESESQKIHSQIEGWRSAWQSKNIAEYMSYYSDEFKSLGMKKSAWQRYKELLASKYATIKVGLSTPVIFQFRDEMVVRMLQDYKSSGKADFGEKILYFKKESGQYRIVAEAWAEETQSTALSEMASQPLTIANKQPASTEKSKQN